MCENVAAQLECHTVFELCISDPLIKMPKHVRGFFYLEGGRACCAEYIVAMCACSYVAVMLGWTRYVMMCGNDLLADEIEIGQCKFVGYSPRNMYYHTLHNPATRAIYLVYGWYFIAIVHRLCGYRAVCTPCCVCPKSDRECQQAAAGDLTIIEHMIIVTGTSGHTESVAS